MPGTGRLLDVSAMPSDQVFICNNGTEIDMRMFLGSHRGAFQELANSGLIDPSRSFGFAMAEPGSGKKYSSWYWDDPETFVWFVGGWGPDRDRCIANAIRKMRPEMRQNLQSDPRKWVSTLDMRFNDPECFREEVRSVNPNGSFSWGDFAWGGAVTIVWRELVLSGAVSGLTEFEDDSTAELILKGLGQKILKGNSLLPK